MDKPAPHKLGARTLVFNLKENEQIFWLDGVVVLPVGSEIELMDPNVNAKVVRVRLLAGGDNVTHDVCLDVEVPEK